MPDQQNPRDPNRHITLSQTFESRRYKEPILRTKPPTVRTGSSTVERDHDQHAAILLLECNQVDAAILQRNRRREQFDILNGARWEATDVVRPTSEEKTAAAVSNHWLLGTKAQNRGSVISDRWRGPAEELAKRHAILVFHERAKGWWKEDADRSNEDPEHRFALIVSIHAPEISTETQTPIDIYTEVATKIQTQIEGTQIEGTEVDLA